MISCVSGKYYVLNKMLPLFMITNLAEPGVYSSIHFASNMTSGEPLPIFMYSLIISAFLCEMINSHELGYILQTNVYCYLK